MAASMGQRFGGTVDDPKAARYSSGNCWRPKGWPSVLTCPAPPSCVWAEQGGAGWPRSLGGIQADISTGAGIAREGAPWSAPIGALKGPEEGRKPPSKIFPRILDTPRFLRIIHLLSAGVAQLVERNLAKVEVASSRLVSRSRTSKRRGSSRSFPFFHIGAGVTKLVAVADLKSAARWAYGFESRSRHQQR